MVTCLSALLLADYVGSREIGWSEFGGENGSGYSPAKQINSQNIQKLMEAWTFHTGDTAGEIPIQCTPLVVGGTMYLVTGGHRVIALDPASGKPKWTFDSKTDLARSGHAKSSRGVAFAQLDRRTRRILYGSPDGRILSIKLTPGFARWTCVVS